MNTSTPSGPAKKKFSLSWRDFTLGTKLIIVFLAVSLIPLVAISIINTQNSRQALLNEANEKLEGAAVQTAAILDAFMTENVNAVRTEAQFAAVVDYVSLPADQRAGSPEEGRLRTYLSSSLRKDPVYLNSVAVLDANGNTLADTVTGAIGTNRSNRYYFVNVLETNRAYASLVEYDTTTRKPSIYFAAPIHDATGEIIGVLRKRFDATVLMEYIVAEKGLVGEGSFPVLLDENNVRLAHATNVSIIYKSVTPIDPAVLRTLQENRLMPPGTSEELSTDRPDFAEGLKNAATQPYFAAELTGDNLLEQAAVAYMRTQPWVVVFAVPQEEFLAPINAQALTNTFITLGIAVAVALFGWLVSRTLSGPIVRLSQTAQAIAGGDINVQARVESGDEIGDLAGTFNQMTAQLRSFINLLEQRVAERTKALATSTEVSRRLSTILDQQQLVTEVVEQVKTAFNYYHAHIYLYDEDKDELVMAGGTGEAGKTMLERGHKIEKGHGLVGRAAESNEVILVSDTRSDPNWLPNPLLPDTRSEVAVPIALGNRVLGVLDVQQNTADGLKSEDVDALQSIANQVSVALQNIAQYQNTQKIATDLSVVAEVGIATATINDTNRLLQEVVDLSKRSFRLYHVHIYLLNEDGDVLELAAGAGDVGRQMVSEGRRIPLDSEKSLVARAARTQAGVVVNDVTADPDFLPNPLLPDTRAEMAVPMMTGGKVIGVLDVQSETLNRFTEVDINIKTTLASQIAVALQNAKSFAQAQAQASREVALNLITQKIQSASSVDMALQIAARELGHALGKRQTLVELKTSLTAEK